MIRISGSVRIEPITTLNPAIAGAELRKESARFDPRASLADSEHPLRPLLIAKSIICAKR